MEIKPGYKQTEIGVIPDDWEVKELKEITSGIGDGIHSTPEYSQRSDYFFINGNNLANGRILFDDNTKSISEREYSKYKTRLTDRTLLLSINGTIGNIAKYNGERILLGKSAAYMTLLSHIDVAFVYYMLQTDNVISYFNNELTGSTIKNLSLLTLRLTPIPSPSNNREKMLISESLSDIDSLITSLEKLIEKKKHIKQGVMQELLTGKSRLPGFSGEWETKRLGDSLVFERPDKYIYWGKELKPQGAIPVLTANKSFILGYANEYAGVYNDVPAIIFDDFTTDCKYVRFPFKVKSSAIKILKPANHDVDLRFIFYTMQSTKFSIGDHKRYYISEYQHLKISLPKIDEQAAIADVIEDIEIEIDLRVKQLNKQILLKQAMMQELLTGRIRLI